MSRTESAIIVALLLAQPAAALAEEPEAAPLFRRARELMQDGRYEEACPLLEESERLDPGVGTEFNLARCYELSGRLARAWRMYDDVARATHATGQTAREEIARARMNELAPRLAHLVLKTTEEPGLVLAVDDAHVAPTAELDYVVDTGAHQIVATAPNKKAWRSSVVVVKGGDRAVVQVPPLEDEDGAASSFAPASPAPATSSAGDTVPSDAALPRRRTQRTVAFALAGATVVMAGIGTYVGIRAIAQSHDADGHCDPTGCDPDGVALRHASLRAGDASTVSFLAAGALGAGAAIVFFTTPEEPSAKRVSLRVGGAGVVLDGRW